jgi:hypothetical protein
LSEQKIYAYGYGADADREISYKAVKTYKITFNLTNVTSSNTSASVAEYADFETTLAISVAGHEWDTVTITMGGVDITADVWKSSTGKITINGVEGNVVITATTKAAAPWSETISNIAVAIRSVWQITSGKPALANSNTEAALGVTTANGTAYTDRESKTVYVMPVNAKACDVTVTANESCTYRFIGLKKSGSTYTTVFTTSKQDSNKHTWSAGAIDNILISLERKDGTSWAWGYNDAQIGVTFTNGVAGGGGSDTPSYTNVIDTVGTQDNVRLRSGGATGSAAGFASNYFPAKGGDIIRVYFPNGNRASIPSNGVYCCTYSNTSGTLVTVYDGSTSSSVLKNVTDKGYEIHIPSSVNCSYARVAGGPNGAYADWVVTVNEEIT